jgi:GGDEF domain-containing protein
MIVDLGPDLPADPRGRADAFRRIGEVATETLRDADVPCRIGETTFGIILEDTAEAGGFWAMDRLRLAGAEVGLPLLHVALATYPNHGLRGDEILHHAWETLERAARAADSAGDL